ncbi:NAD(P)-dependent oxidoreductase [Streptomonospora wellingtoniae]|uniref:SDR family oxidoreductase n=1 Tax=Streptomonospora wellingtoniae TaxID=3075544 RepID=A0ABU2KY22_9ACTN|nr:SDR family oxidoreductase [Streptomonospora sp. DSM 45055]MDT0303938.1 SDR family oxidoreductase [Streptomonospora sp. DSM 45055]
MKAAVLGAGGRTGRLVVARALERGHEVVAAGRDISALDRLRSDTPQSRRGRLTVRPGDVDDPAALEAAVDGADVVLSTVAPPLHKHILRSTTLYSRSARRLVDALRARGVRRLITVSSAGVLHEDPSHPALYRHVLKPVLFDRALYRDMRIMEREIEESGLDWTLVRASGLTDRPATGRYRLGSGRLPDGGSRVSRADLADFLVVEIEEGAHTGGHPTLAY